MTLKLKNTMLFLNDLKSNTKLQLDNHTNNSLITSTCQSLLEVLFSDYSFWSCTTYEISKAYIS